MREIKDIRNAFIIKSEERLVILEADESVIKDELFKDIFEYLMKREDINDIGDPNEAMKLIQRIESMNKGV